MSLIDEALKRARMEAAQKAAQSEGLPYPTIPRHLGPKRRTGWLVPLVVALAVIGGVIIGLALASRGGSQAPRTADLGTIVGAPAPMPEPSAPAAEQPAAGEAKSPTALPAGPRPRTDENTTAPPLELEPAARESTSSAATAMEPTPAAAPPPVGAPPRAPAREPQTSPSPSRPSADSETLAAATAQPPAVASPATPPAAAPPLAAPVAPGVSSRADTRPSPSGATTVTDPDSGVLLVLPERSAPAEAEGATPPLSEASTETHTQQYPLPGGGAIELGGIAWSETGPFALINGRVVGPGSVIENYTLERIRPGHVVLTGEGRRIHLSLQ